MRVSDTLSKSDVHEAWIANLRTEEVNAFGFRALARLIKLTQLQRGSRVLDAGCGSGTNTAWLAREGFDVTGVDFSEFALKKARESGLENLVRGDLTDLPFDGDSFDAVFCIGVLMHVPDVESALREIARVTRPGGWLILAETNAYAPETYAFRAYWRLKRNIRVERTVRGVEAWAETSAGPLLSRKVSVRWISEFLGELGMTRFARTTGELTELYAYGRFRKLFHRLNALWFKLRGPPSLAIGNYLVFRKCPGGDLHQDSG